MKNCVIISAERYTLTEIENRERTKQLVKRLTILGIPCELVNGMFNGSSEKSIIISYEGYPIRLAAALDLAFRKYDQEAILILDSECIGTLQYKDANKADEIIGQFKALDSYTRVNDKVYTCQPLESNLDTTHTKIRRI